MSYLLTADTHFTDQAKDAYRFDIFKWLRQQQKLHKPEATFLLGDLTAQKDKHSSFLTNKLVEGVLSLEPPLFILKGNHDYIDPDFAFFKFLRHIEGIRFISKPTEWHHIGLLPHIRGQQEFDEAVRSFKDELDFLFIHQCVEGAIAETGARLSGTSTAAIEENPPRLGVYAGDIHRPQQVGIVTYVGAPYHVRFGDAFDPRVLLLHKNGKSENLHFDCPRKWSLTVRSADEIIGNKQLFEGDQIKVTIELASEEATEWRTYKQEVIEACRTMKLEVFGVDLKINKAKERRRNAVKAKIQPRDVLSAFCTHERVPKDVREAGLIFLEG